MAPVPFCVLFRHRAVGRGGIIVHDQDQVAADLLRVGLEFDAAAEQLDSWPGLTELLMDHG